MAQKIVLLKTTNLHDNHFDHKRNVHSKKILFVCTIKRKAAQWKTIFFSNLGYLASILSFEGIRRMFRLYDISEKSLVCFLKVLLQPEFEFNFQKGDYKSRRTICIANNILIRILGHCFIHRLPSSNQIFLFFFSSSLNVGVLLCRGLLHWRNSI